MLILYQAKAVPTSLPHHRMTLQTFFQTKHVTERHH
jgi:hypothetical protein